MAPRSVKFRPLRTLGVLVSFLAVLFGLIGAGVLWSDAQWSPKLALDLEGGTEIVLNPVPQAGAQGAITQDTIKEAVNIIKQRINGSGVSEAEVSTQGTNSIIVSLPGKPDQATVDSVKQAAALEFRAVLVEQSTAPPPPSPSASGTGASPSAGASANASSSAKPSAAASSGSTLTKPKATSTGNGKAITTALLAATTSPTAAPTASGAAATPAASGAAASPQPKPTDASDTNWIDQKIATEFQSLDCNTPKGVSGADTTKPLVACSQDGSAKYILGPAEVLGRDISAASANLETTSQGATGTMWQVNLSFDGKGSSQFAKVTQRLTALQQPRNQFAIVLDGLVVSAPRTNEAITGGQAQITGNFDQVTAQSLANQLKFGALPISFKVQTEDQISATLGGEQLQRGLLAGLIGLLLVVLYSLLQYRALGFVTIASLTIAGVITYGLVALMGWRQGYRLSLPGVAGLIVSIGITADSFIVYFERIRDEVRDGRTLLVAVDSAWVRARRTILASDTVSFLAALVLYALAIGGVKGFAFTLGLTTVVDVLVVFLFTHPVLVLLARTRFFGGGHKLSGFDPVHLGRETGYVGRGKVRPPVTSPGRPHRPTRTPEPATVGAGARGAAAGTIAERRAARERAERDPSVPPAGGPDPSDGTVGESTATTRRDS